ncbi:MULTISPECIES: hypothetical protein [unclassified Frankia]|uniref:hypothetical protein n=1 Tax=unclassified Frankia TaxID=2632575 RepID=UPI0019325673|nr:MULTISPECIES: hypothetical protein [unclassified Frankia]MBL7624902.1 hypothetical protein [Frankia sp. AgB1.8]
MTATPPSSHTSQVEQLRPPQTGMVSSHVGELALKPDGCLHRPGLGGLLNGDLPDDRAPQDQGAQLVVQSQQGHDAVQDLRLGSGQRAGYRESASLQHFA